MIPSVWPGCPSYLSGPGRSTERSTGKTHADVRHAIEAQILEDQTDVFFSADRVNSLEGMKNLYQLVNKRLLSLEEIVELH